MEFEEIKLYESEHDLCSRMNNLSGWKKFRLDCDSNPDFFWWQDASLYPVIAKDRVRFLVIPEFFSTALVVHSTAKVMFTLSLYNEI